MQNSLTGHLRRALRASLGEGVVRRLRGLRARFESTEETFTRIRRDNAWGSDESVSGQGSTAAYTENIRREIPQLLAKLGVQRMLDAPCGDYNWFRLVQRPAGLEYVGGDIVRELVERNNALYRDLHTRFVPLDITADALPRADLWLCRDALFHLSDRLILQAIDNFLRSDIPYLLTTSHTACLRNVDVPTGDYREINLRLAPFRFPEPECWIDDWIPGFPVRRLGLWQREELARALQSAARDVPGSAP
jgi:hypothetical protein